VISSYSAGARPIVSPPWIWPSTIIGLMMLPQSSTATKRRTLTSPVPLVDVDHADVAAEREGQVRRVVVVDRLEAGLHPGGWFV
jgi:hypothetical protein